MLRKSFSHDGAQVDGGVRSKALSGLFNLGWKERYTLGREWDGSAGASRLFVGQILTRRKLSMHMRKHMQ